MALPRLLFIIFVLFGSMNRILGGENPLLTLQNAQNTKPSASSDLLRDMSGPEKKQLTTGETSVGEPIAPCDFVTDHEIKKSPVESRPGYLVPYTDPVFGTKVVRVTDPGNPIPKMGGNWQSVARHHYSVDQAWNADQTLLMLDRGTSGRGKLFLDGNTYEPLFLRKAPSSEHRWHPRISDLRIFVGENQVGTWNVRTGDSNIIGTVKDYKEFKFGPNKGNPSRDGTRIAVLAKDKNSRQVAFAYDLAWKRKYPDINLHELNIGWVSISPLGNYIMVQEKGTDRSRVYDIQGHQVGPEWSEYGRPSHFDLTVDDNGDEVAVGVSKSAPNKGQVIKRRLRDGGVIALTEKGYAAHTTARNTSQPGWVYVSYHAATNWPPYNCEVVAVKLDGSKKVKRLFHTHYAKSGYLSETHPSVSPDGTKIIWASNWNDASAPLAAYVAEICNSPLNDGVQPAKKLPTTQTKP